MIAIFATFALTASVVLCVGIIYFASRDRCDCKGGK